MAITKANELKKIRLTAKKEMRSFEFIPAELEVANLSTLLTNKDREEAADIMDYAWNLAAQVRFSEGYSKIVLGKAKCYGFSKGALVFLGQREESDLEFDARLGREADWKAQDLRRAANDKARQNKKDRDELARLQAKLGV
jgi:hypothetical protein